MTPFRAILQAAVENTPGLVGGAFAAYDGEMVDSFAAIDADEWALLTAHYGIVLCHLRDAFGTWHYGAVEHFVLEHSELDVMVKPVDDAYFALLAMRKPAILSLGLSALRQSVTALRKEIA